MKKCAPWLAGHLRRIGLESVRVIPTSGHPIVYAAWWKAPDRPTVLIYGQFVEVRVRAGTSGHGTLAVIENPLVGGQALARGITKHFAAI